MKGQKVKGDIEQTIRDLPLKMVGRILSDRFRLVDFLGSGAMSNTYLAETLKREEAIPSRVAIKIYKEWVLEEETQAKRITREVDEISRIDHPNLKKIFGYRIQQDEHSALIYLVMEYLPGITLARFIEESGPLSEHEIVGILLQISSGVKALHDQHIVHRDLKPDNIMILHERRMKPEIHERVVTEPP